MRQLLIFSYLVAVSLSSVSQVTFERKIGGKENDNGMGVTISPSGYITAGSTRSADNTNFDIYLVKTNLEGDTLWTRIYGGPDNETAEDIIHNGDGTYTVCGTAWNNNDQKSDLCLLKINEAGDSLWAANDFSDLSTFGNSIAVTIDGFIACGYSNTANNTSVMSVFRIGADGSPVWSRLYGEGSGSVGTSIASTPDGGFIACGYIDTYTPGWNRNIYLVRITPSGDTLWTRQYAGPEYDAAFGVNMTFDGGYILTGYTFNLGAQSGDLVLIKTDAEGEVQWQKTYGGSGLDIGEAGAQTSDGNYIFTGMTSEAGSELKQLYLVRTDSDGDTLWTRKYGEYPRNYGYDILQTPDLGFIIAGMSDNTIGNSYDVYLVKTAPDGTITGTDFNTKPGELTAFPNPFYSFIHVRAKSLIQSLTCFNLSGVPVLNVIPDNMCFDLTLDCSSMQPGAYILKVKAETGTHFLKMIKLL